MSFCHYWPRGGGVRANLDNVTKYEGVFLKASLGSNRVPGVSKEKFFHNQYLQMMLDFLGPKNPQKLNFCKKGGPHMRGSYPSYEGHLLLQKEVMINLTGFQVSQRKNSFIISTYK